MMVTRIKRLRTLWLLGCSILLTGGCPLFTPASWDCCQGQQLCVPTAATLAQALLGCPAQIHRPLQVSLLHSLPHAAQTWTLVHSTCDFALKWLLTHIVFQLRTQLAPVTKHYSEFSNFFFFWKYFKYFSEQRSRDAIFISPGGWRASLFSAHQTSHDITWIFHFLQVASHQDPQAARERKLPGAALCLG